MMLHYEDALHEIRKKAREIDEYCTDLGAAQELAQEIVELSFTDDAPIGKSERESELEQSLAALVGYMEMMKQFSPRGAAMGEGAQGLIDKAKKLLNLP